MLYCTTIDNLYSTKWTYRISANSFLHFIDIAEKKCLMYVNLQSLGQLFEIFFNAQIQNMIVVKTIICGNMELVFIDIFLHRGFMFRVPSSKSPFISPIF